MSSTEPSTVWGNGWGITYGGNKVCRVTVHMDEDVRIALGLSAAADGRPVASQAYEILRDVLVDKVDVPAPVCTFHPRSAPKGAKAKYRVKRGRGRTRRG